MSGGRFVSIIFTLVLAFLWGGFVVHKIHTNKSNQKIAGAEKAAGVTSSEEARKSALDHADEMAIAASEEFTKHTEGEIVDAGAPSGEPKFVWKVPDAASPDYDEFIAIKVGNSPWQVPYGADPIYASRVAANIESVATSVKEEATDAAEKVGGKIAAIADDVKETIVGAKKWRVPTAVDPISSSTVTDKKAVSTWQVPFGADPQYEDGVAVVAIKDETKLEDTKIDANALDLAVISKIEDAGASAELAKSSYDEALGKGLKDKEPLRVAKVDDGLAREVGGKDGARLSKDITAISVSKYKWRVPDGATPSYAGSSEPLTAWRIPTGIEPDYGVVSQLERSFDAVKGVASEASIEIADKVSSLGNNVKGAIASPKRWVVPTGVTPKSDKIQVAGLNDKAWRVPDSVTPDYDNLVEDGPAKIEVDTALAEKPTGDQELFVSSELQYGDKKPIVVAEAKQDATKLPKDDAVSKDGGKSGVLNYIIDYFSDNKKKTNGGNDDPYHVSRIDKVRFEAIKSLIIDELKYDFTNAKKGEGKLKFSGRAQPNAKLLLYSGPRYLGEVVSDDSGKWKFDGEVYLSKGEHIIHAQQVSDGGVVLARKAQTIAQLKNVKPPKGYKPGIGIDIGDKALAELQSSLGKDKGGKNKAALEKAANDKTPQLDVGKEKGAKVKDAKVKDAEKKPAKLVTETKVAAAPDAPIPSRKPKERSIGSAKKDTAKNAKKADKASPDKASVKKAKVVADKSDKKLKVAAIDKKSKVDKTQADKSNSEVGKAPSKVTGEPKYYVVKAGDTLGKIAKKVYGSGDRYKEIIALNAKLIKNPNRIYPKQKLLVASGDTATLGKKVASVDKKAALKKPAGKKPDNAAKIKSDLPKYYIVKQGDSLWKIAKKVYGNGRLYQKLIKLNKKGLANPSKIKINQRLVVS